MRANYEESELILTDLFPKDRAIFLLCGGAGYSAMTKALLIEQGWDANKLYVLGPAWEYQGTQGIPLVDYSEEVGGNDHFAPWRADTAIIDFSEMHPLPAT